MGAAEVTGSPVAMYGVASSMNSSFKVLPHKKVVKRRENRYDGNQSGLTSFEGANTISIGLSTAVNGLPPKPMKNILRSIVDAYFSNYDDQAGPLSDQSRGRPER